LPFSAASACVCDERAERIWLVVVLVVVVDLVRVAPDVRLEIRVVGL